MTAVVAVMEGWVRASPARDVCTICVPFPPARPSCVQAIWELSFAGGEVELRPVGRWLASMVRPELWPRQQQAGQGGQQELAGQGEQGLQGEQQHGGLPEGPQQGIQCVDRQQGDAHVERQEDADGVQCASGGEVGARVGSGSGPRARLGWWHPRWGDRECGLVFIGVGLGEVGLGEEESSRDGGGVDGEAEVGSHVAGAGVGGRGAQKSGLAVEVAGAQEGRRGPGGVRGELGAGQRLRELLKWALVTEEEEGVGEEAWEAWDDSMWLGLMERL